MVSAYSPFLVSLENLLLQFCFDFTLCPFTVRQGSSKINGFPRCTVGHVSFEWCHVLCDLFFHYSEKREKGEDLGLLHFSVVSLLFILTFTSCLSSLYHPNVLRSKQNVSPFHSFTFRLCCRISTSASWQGKAGTEEQKSLITFFFPPLALTV